MSDAFLGQISMFSGNFAPKGTALCNGQILPISQNTALFALLGTTYGGNGTTTFALPNLQSRLPMHQGQGAGLSAYSMGQISGAASVTIAQASMPAHSHTFNVSTADGGAAPIGDHRLPAKPIMPNAAFYAVTQPLPNPPLVPQTLATGACGNTGGNQPHTNLMPSLCISFIIYLQGIFPSRN